MINRKNTEKTRNQRSKKAKTGGLTGWTEVSHGTAYMASMRIPWKRLGDMISIINRSGDVGKLDNVASTPFLYSKVLDINVAGSRSRPIFIHHSDGSLVILVKHGGTGRGKAKVSEYRPEVLDNLCTLNSRSKFGISQ